MICDFARYPEWVSSVKVAQVVEEYEDGYASQVRFALDAGVLVDEYTLRYEYAEDLSRIEWTLAAPSRVQRPNRGHTTSSRPRRCQLDGDVCPFGRVGDRHDRDAET